MKLLLLKVSDMMCIGIAHLHITINKQIWFIESPMFNFIFRLTNSLYVARTLLIIKHGKIKIQVMVGARVMVFNGTFHNISVISWRSVLLMDVRTHNVSDDRH